MRSCLLLPTTADLQNQDNKITNIDPESSLPGKQNCPPPNKKNSESTLAISFVRIPIHLIKSIPYTNI